MEMVTFADICQLGSTNLHSGPWRVGPFRFATDGHLIVSSRDAIQCASACPEPMASSVEAKYLAASVESFGAFDIAVLSAFVGPHREKSTIECDVCFGTGRNTNESHDCQHCGMDTAPICSYCDGTGRVEQYTPDRPVSIFGVRFDARLVAMGLAALGLSEGQAQMGLLPVSGGHHAFVVATKDKRLVLMCRSDVVGPMDAKFPS